MGSEPPHCPYSPHILQPMGAPHCYTLRPHTLQAMSAAIIAATERDFEPSQRKIGVRALLLRGKWPCSSTEQYTLHQ